MAERQYTESGGVQRRKPRTGRVSDSGQPYPILPTRADLSNKWQNDLFEAGSNVYQPRVNFKGKALPSTSLKPFGSATPDMEPLSTVNRPRIQPRSLSEGNASIFDRISGMKTAKGTQRNPSRTTERSLEAVGNPARQTAGTGSLASRLGLVDVARGKQRERKQRERGAAGIKGAAKAVEQAPPQPSPGTVVIVQNLVAGTTADDVRAAFSEFGHILECSVAKMPNKPLFAAEVLFRVYEEAETARSTLDGVLADGEKLSVTLRPAAPLTEAKSRVSRNDPGIASRLGAPMGRSAEARANALSAPPVTERKLHSDAILAMDPRASVITDPHDHNKSRGRPPASRKNRNRAQNGMDLD